MGGAPGGFAFRIEGQHKAGIAQRVFMQWKVGQGRVAAEVRVGALVERQRRYDICFEVRDEEVAVDIRPVDAGVGYFGFEEIVEGLFPGGRAGDGISGVGLAGGKAASISVPD